MERCLASLVVTILVASSGCQAKRVVTIRLDSTRINVLFYSRGTIRFEPTGDTEFKRTGSGSWEDGAVTYGVNDEGVFEIVMDGTWMQATALENREIYPGEYILEIPLKNVENRGTFLVSVEYEYEDPETGWRVVAEGRRYGEVEFPYHGDTSENILGIIMQCADELNEACYFAPADPDDSEPVPDGEDVAEEADLPDTSVDGDVPDTTPDTAPDTEPDTTSDTEPDTTSDTEPDTTSDATDTPSEDAGVDVDDADADDASDADA